MENLLIISLINIESTAQLALGY